MTDYSIHVSSTTDIYKHYWIEVDVDRQTVTCNCKSGRIRGYCKHIKFYKKLIKELVK